MTKLPDEDFLKLNQGISDEQIKQDIADTQKEIDRLQSAKALNYGFGYESRLAAGYSRAIEERREFIWDLEHLLKLRSDTHMFKPKQYIGIQDPSSYQAGHNDHIVLISQECDKLFGKVRPPEGGTS